MKFFFYNIRLIEKRFFREYVGDENCLYLNIYTSSKTANEKLPVIVWIHGGGFLYGSACDKGGFPHVTFIRNLYMAHTRDVQQEHRRD